MKKFLFYIIKEEEFLTRTTFLTKTIWLLSKKRSLTNTDINKFTIWLACKIWVKVTLEFLKEKLFKGFIEGLKTFHERKSKKQNKIGARKRCKCESTTMAFLKYTFLLKAKIKLKNY